MGEHSVGLRAVAVQGGVRQEEHPSETEGRQHLKSQDEENGPQQQLRLAPARTASSLVSSGEGGWSTPATVAQSRAEEGQVGN